MLPGRSSRLEITSIGGRPPSATGRTVRHMLRRSAAAAFSAATVVWLTLAGPAASAPPRPPDPPQNVQVTTVSDTAITLSWGVPRARTTAVRYALFLDGGDAGTTTALGHVFGGLGCGTVHTVGVATVVQDGSRSVVRARTRRTDRCPPGPTVTLTATPPALTNSAGATFRFTSSAGTRFACSLDGAAFAACASPAAYSGLSDGAHSFSVTASRGANTGAAAAYSWTIDTVAPTVTLTSTPPALTNNPSATFAFTSSDATASFECSLDGAAFAACASPASSSALADGAHSFSVRAHDPAGNTGAAAAYSWTIDTSGSGPPIVTISDGPPALSGSADATFTFASSDTTATFECSLDGAAFAACTSPTSYTGLADGIHTFQVRAVRGGDAGPAASYTWTIDTGFGL